MSQNFDTTIGLSADFSSAGLPFDFDGAFVSNLVITNNSGVGIQYTPDGTTWTTISPGGSASPTVPDSTTFYLRKMAAGGAPASVRVQWRARDSLDPSIASIRTRLNVGIANYATRRGRSPFVRSTVTTLAPTITTNTSNLWSATCPSQQAISTLLTPRYGVIQSGATDSFVQVQGTALQANSTGGSLGFVLTGQKVLFLVKDSVSYNYIRVNGDLIQSAVFDTTGASTYVFIDFGAVGDYAIEVDFCKNGGLKGVWTENTGKIRPLAPWPVKVLLAGDSTSANAVSDVSAANTDLYGCRLFPRLLADMLVANVVQSATPSMGWVNGSMPMTDSARLADFVAAGASADAGAIVMGVNDAPSWLSTITYPQLYAAVQFVCRAWAAANPYKPLTVFGVLRSSAFSTDTGSEACILQAVSDLNSSLIRGYPSCTGTSPFITGSGKQGSATGVGTSDWIVGPDGTHLTLAGQQAAATFVGDCLVDHWLRLQ